MKTITLQNPGEFQISDTVEPAGPGSGEALVRVRRIGVCGTDFHAFRGRQPFFTYPRILGHELGVEVTGISDASDQTTVRVGDRCAVEPYLNCGHCVACRRGKTNCCASLRVLGVHIDGGMREYITVPIHKLHPSSRLSLEQLALVETLGIGAHAVARARPEPLENVLVVGAGPIGLSVIQFASIVGSRVIVLDVNQDRLDFCQKQMGVDAVILASDDTPDRLLELTNGDLPTAVFDATGNQVSMEKSFQFVAPGGRLTFVGLFQGNVTFNDPEFHRKEMTILSTRNSTGADFRRIIDLMETGQVDTTPWITHKASFETLSQNFSGWLDPAQGVIKAMVEVC